MSIEFPYQYKIITEGKIPDPVIQLWIKTKFGLAEADFLVDSGADTTTLPLVWGKFFGLRVKSIKQERINGIEGTGIAAYPGKIELQIGRRRLKIRCMFVNSNVMPLLGRLDIWDKFSIIFDNKKDRVVFKSI